MINVTKTLPVFCSPKCLSMMTLICGVHRGLSTIITVNFMGVSGARACCVAYFGRCIFLSVDVGIRQKICSQRLHSSGGQCGSRSGICI